MRRKIYSFLLLICLLLSCNGCQDTKETEKSNVSSQQDDTQKKEKSEVRSSFTTKQAETEEEQETQETKLTEETETESTQEEPGAIAASEDTYDYVALGNSITCNEIEEGLWWGNWGMAASSEEKDYVHLVSNWLGGQSVRPVTTTVLDLKKWEVAQKRDDILADYETYFSAAHYDYALHAEIRLACDAPQRVGVFACECDVENVAFLHAVVAAWDYALVMALDGGYVKLVVGAGKLFQLHSYDRRSGAKTHAGKDYFAVVEFKPVSRPRVF